MKKKPIPFELTSVYTIECMYSIILHTKFTNTIGNKVNKRERKKRTQFKSPMKI